MAWINRLANLFKKKELESGLEEELRFHLDARAADNISSGMSTEEARYDANRRFGSRALAAERTREADILGWLDSLAKDLRYAVRGLSKSPGFTSVALLVLGLGIGATTSVFTVVNSVLLQPLPFPASDRLFQLSFDSSKRPFFVRPSMTDHHYLEYQRHHRSFENVATYGFSAVTLTRAGDPVRLAAATVSTDFFRVLGVQPAAGRGFADGEGQDGRNRLAVIGHELWRARFGADPAMPGKTITLDGIPHTVIGVMPAAFAFPSDADLWIPLAVLPPSGNSFSRPVIGRLREGVTPEQAQAEFTGISRSFDVDNPKDWIARIVPLKDAVVGNIQAMLWVFSGAVAFVLLIACANVGNLLLIRATARQQEISVRAALGASRWRLIRQILIESTLLSVGGAILGVVVAEVAVPLLLTAAPEGKIPRTGEIRPDAWVLAFAFGVAIITGVIFGLAPALRATARGLRESLAESSRTVSRGNERLRSAFVAAEVALALVLLTGAGLLLKSFTRMHAVDPGFRPQNVVTLNVGLPESQYRNASQLQSFHQRTLAGLSGLPGVTEAGMVNWMPFGRALITGDFEVQDGRSLPPGFRVAKPVVSPGYFRLMGIPLLSGRDFAERDHATAPRVAIVSRSTARAVWPGEDAVGKRVSMSSRPKPEDWITVIGVVEDIRQQGFTEKPAAALYLPYPQVNQVFFLSTANFVVRTAADPAAIARGMRQVVKQADPDVPVQSIQTMEDVIAGTTAEPRFRARLLTLFSVMALLLAAIGIYGSLACSVAERTHEIGIRMALGASSGEVVGMVVRRSLLMAVIGTAAGTVGALALTRVLEGFLFEVKPTDPATFISVAAILLLVALLAGLLPARRASAVDPLIALRTQ